MSAAVIAGRHGVLDGAGARDRAVRVWAPRASVVRLHRERDGLIERLAMDAQPGGWFALDQALRVGDRYGFLLDDDEHPLPDPASRRARRARLVTSSFAAPLASTSGSQPSSMRASSARRSS